MILLIQPGSGRWEKIGFRMPLGLLYLATFLKKHGILAKIIDTRVNLNWKREISGSLHENDIVGITCMIGPQVKNSLEIARYIKEVRPNTTVVFGGIHPTLVPEQALREECIDIVVRGEGEKPFLEIARHRQLSEIRGISFKDPCKIIRHNLLQEKLNPEDILIPEYSFLDMSKYSSTNYSGEKGLSIQTSRGCPYSCGFCYNSDVNCRSWRPFSIEKVIDNIDILVTRHGAKTIYFVDDNVAADQKRFLELLKIIRGRPYKLNLAFQGVRIDALERFNDEIFSLLRESGVRSIDIGVESLNQGLLRKIDKHLTPDQILRTLEKIEKKNFNLKLNFLSGLPGQSKEEIKFDIGEAKKLARRHKNSYIVYSIFMPFPGTKLYREAIEAGFREPSSFEAWSVFAGTSWMRRHSWFSKKTINHLENMHFLFLLSNKNILTKVSNKFTKVLLRLYQPIANFRLQNKIYFFMAERKLTELLD